MMEEKKWTSILEAQLPKSFQSIDDKVKDGQQRVSPCPMRSEAIAVAQKAYHGLQNHQMQQFSLVSNLFHQHPVLLTGTHFFFSLTSV